MTEGIYTKMFKASGIVQKKGVGKSDTLGTNKVKPNWVSYCPPISVRK